MIMNTTEEKVIDLETQHLSTTEYTLNINLQLPEGYKLVEEPHVNKLSVSFSGPEDGPDGQNMIVRDNPSFPLGIPVRGNSQWVALTVDYSYKFLAPGKDSPTSESVRYRIPVHMDGDGKDTIDLNETLPI